MSYLRTLYLSIKTSEVIPVFSSGLYDKMSFRLPSEPFHRSHIFAVFSGMMMSQRGVAINIAGLLDP